MKRHKALILLSHDHHKGLLLAQLLKKNAPPYKGLPKDPVGKMNYAIEAFNSELTIHFKDEEELLFPILKSKSKKIDDIINELLTEHSELKNKILSLKSGDDLVNKLDDIGNILEKHIRKEERVLFQEAQAILKDAELKTLEGEIELSRKEFQKTCISKSINENISKLQ